MFNILQEDSDVVDLITTIGPPFPKHTHSPSHLAPSPPSIDMDQRPCGGVESRHGDSGLELVHDDRSEGVSNDEEIGLDSDPVVHVVLRGHEGVPAAKPFTIQPVQMVCCLAIHQDTEWSTYMCVVPLRLFRLEVRVQSK